MKRPASPLPVLAAVTLLVLGGCGSGEEAEPVAFADVALQAFSGVKVFREIAVQDAPGWAALWAEHVSNVSPSPPRPDVDFSTQTVAAVFLGEQTTCRRPVIEKVERTAAPRILVRYRIEGPGATELCPAVVMTPAHLVRFANPGRVPVEFRAAR